MAFWKTLPFLCVVLLSACRSDGQGTSNVIDVRMLSDQLGVEVAHFDTTTRAQDNFYQYVNGRWLDMINVPSIHSSYGSFTEAKADVQSHTWRTIDRLVAKSPAERTVREQKLVRFYQLATKHFASKQESLSALTMQIERINKINDHADLLEEMGRLMRVGLDMPFVLEVKSSVKLPGINILHLEQGNLFLPEQYYDLETGGFEPRVLTAFNMMINSLNYSVEGLSINAEGVLDLEQRLFLARRDAASRRVLEDSNNLFVASKGYFPSEQFQWAAFFRGLELSPKTINLVDIPYFKGVEAALKNIDLEVWKDFLKAQIIFQHARLFSGLIDVAYNQFRDGVLRGVVIPRPADDRARLLVSRVFSSYFDGKYIEDTVALTTRERIENMALGIKQAFAKRIEASDWMDDASKAEALKKLNRTRFKIIGPKNIQHIDQWQLDENDFSQTVLNFIEQEFLAHVSRLDKAVDDDEWRVEARTVNAYYSPPLNEIVLPAGILQPPFFDDRSDDAVNYGGIGGIIAHELIHGFDDQGHLVDADGELRDWWSQEAKREFDQRAEAFLDYYDQRQIKDIGSLNGRLTLGENIADVEGLAVAWDAYSAYKGLRRLPRIVGFSADQRFFLGWAQMWRRIYRDDDIRRRLLTDSHSIASIRVNEAVSQMYQFEQAFRVDRGDGMWVPRSKRLRIW